MDQGEGKGREGLVGEHGLVGWCCFYERRTSWSGSTWKCGKKWAAVCLSVCGFSLESLYNYILQCAYTCVYSCQMFTASEIATHKSIYKTLQDFDLYIKFFLYKSTYIMDNSVISSYIINKARKLILSIFLVISSNLSSQVTGGSFVIKSRLIACMLRRVLQGDCPVPHAHSFSTAGRIYLRCSVCVCLFVYLISCESFYDKKIILHAFVFACVYIALVIIVATLVIK